MIWNINIDSQDVEDAKFDDKLLYELNKIQLKTSTLYHREIIQNTIYDILLESKCIAWKVCILQEAYYINNKE